MSNKRDKARGTKLLLIWSQPDSSKVAKILLEKEGHAVVAVSKPAEGIEQIKKLQDEIDLCVLDLTKIGATEKLYDALARRSDDVSPDADTIADDDARDAAIPILFIAQSDAEGDAAVKASGLVAAYIVKPYDKSDLLEQVGLLLAGPG